MWRRHRFPLAGDDPPRTKKRAAERERSALLFHRRRLSAAGDDHVVRCASTGKLGSLLLNALCRISIARYGYRNDSFCQERRTGPRIGHRRDTETHEANYPATAATHNIRDRQTTQRHRRHDQDSQSALRSRELIPASPLCKPVNRKSLIVNGKYRSVLQVVSESPV